MALSNNTRRIRFINVHKVMDFPGFSGVSDKMILFKHEKNSEKIKI